MKKIKTFLISVLIMAVSMGFGYETVLVDDDGVIVSPSDLATPNNIPTLDEFGEVDNLVFPYLFLDWDGKVKKPLDFFDVNNVPTLDTRGEVDNFEFPYLLLYDTGVIKEPVDFPTVNKIPTLNVFGEVENLDFPYLLLNDDGTVLKPSNFFAINGVTTTNIVSVSAETDNRYSVDTTQYFFDAEKAYAFDFVTNISSVVTNYGKVILSPSPFINDSWYNLTVTKAGTPTISTLDPRISSDDYAFATNDYFSNGGFTWNINNVVTLARTETGWDDGLKLHSWTNALGEFECQVREYRTTYGNTDFPPDGGVVYGTTTLTSNDVVIATTYDDELIISYEEGFYPSIVTNFVVATNILYSPVATYRDLTNSTPIPSDIAFTTSNQTFTASQTFDEGYVRIVEYDITTNDFWLIENAQLDGNVAPSEIHYLGYVGLGDVWIEWFELSTVEYEFDNIFVAEMNLVEPFTASNHYVDTTGVYSLDLIAQISTNYVYTYYDLSDISTDMETTLQDGKDYTDEQIADIGLNRYAKLDEANTFIEKQSFSDGFIVGIDANIDEANVAIGNNSKATSRIVSNTSIALGDESKATDERSISIGYRTETTEDNQVAIGSTNTPIKVEGTSFTYNGHEVTTTNDIPVLTDYAKLDEENTFTAEQDFADGVFVSGMGLAVGLEAVAGLRGMAVGYRANAGTSSVALAPFSNAQNGGIAIGNSVSAQESTTIAIGTSANQLRLEGDSFTYNGVDVATVNDIPVLTEYAKKVNDLVDKSNAIVNISTDDIATYLTITEDTTIVLDNTVGTNVTSVQFLQFDIGATVYDVAISNAQQSTYFEIGSNTSYRTVLLLSKGEWSWIGIDSIGAE